MAAVDPAVLAQATALVRRSQYVSVSYLQRRLPIYTRREAVEVLAALEAEGVVGPDRGDETRDVLIRPET